MVFKNELYPIHFYGRVRGKCDGRLQNWPGIANERPKFLAMRFRAEKERSAVHVLIGIATAIEYILQTSGNAL